MKYREPTDEERALWHEANRHTTRVEQSISVPPIPSPLPKPVMNPVQVLPRVASHAVPKTELAPLSLRQAARHFKPHGAISATLDLHGYTREQAYHIVQQFILRARHEGMRHVLVITGKGRLGEGVLRENLPHWLNEPALRPHISAISYARPEKGGDGALHLLLKKPL